MFLWMWITLILNAYFTCNNLGKKNPLKNGVETHRQICKQS